MLKYWIEIYATMVNESMKAWLPAMKTHKEIMSIYMGKGIFKMMDVPEQFIQNILPGWDFSLIDFEQKGDQH